MIEYDKKGLTEELESAVIRNQLLEHYLRLLGNFDKKKNIRAHICSEESYNDIIYEVVDNNLTSYKIHNFGLSSDLDKNRYRKNYQILMQRENSNFIYKYDYSDSIYNIIDTNLYLAEIKELGNIICTLTLYKWNYSIKIEIDDKQYIIDLNIEENAINDLITLYFKVVKDLKTKENLNIETLLNLINSENIRICHVHKENAVEATLNYLNGQLRHYEIVTPNKRVIANIKNDINRIVERKGIECYREVLSPDSEKYQKEYKSLIKEM